MKKDYSYYAFISYNHHDEKKAKWLQSRLEHYRLPAVARKEVGEDVKIRPIFRYVSDLGVALLREKIKQELDASKYLIVICSPHSAKPNVKGDHWVNDEVKRFCDTGRQDCIIPAIVDGVPGDEERECFCPELAKLEIAGVDFQKEKKNVCIQKIVAKLLGLRPDILIERYREEEKKKRRRIFLGFVPFIALLLLGGLFIWDSTRLVTRYYADYVDSFGLPEGIYELSKDQIAGRNFHYRFEFKGYQYGDSPHADSGGASLFGFRRKLMRVVQAGSSGFPRKVDHTEYSDRPAMQDFEYDKDNRLSKIFYGRYNGENRPPYVEKRLEFYNENAVTNGLVKFFSSKEGQLDIAYSAAAPTSVKLEPGTLTAKADITQHLLMRDALGRVVRRNFLNNSGAKVADADGIWGVEYEYDDFGRKVAEWHLSPINISFERRANKIGVAGRKYKYHNASIERTEYVNSEGSPVLNQHGWIVAEVVSWDEWGNPLCQIYKDEKGRAMMSKDGYAEFRNEYDARGNVTKKSFFGVDGEPILLIDGYAEFRTEYDACGNATRESYFGVDGEPILLIDGYAEFRKEYDARGNVTRESYFGVDGKPILHKDGYAEFRAEYDQRGNLTKWSYFGVDSEPILLKDGFAEFRTEYDAHGNMTKTSYYGVDGKSILHKDGNAGWGAEYDEFGRETCRKFFDVDGKPILLKDGFAELRKEYDTRGNVTRESYFGVDGKPILHKNGCAEFRAEYDQRGNMTKVSDFGVDGKPILHKDGFAELRREYDARGNLTRESSLGVDGKPILLKDGFAELRKEYDARGNVTRESYFGVDGKPILHKDGCAEIRKEYDARGNLTRESSLGVDGKPTLHKYGFAESRVEYDQRGNVTKKSFFGVDGEPILLKNGYAECRNEYDQRGNLTRESYFGVDGKPILHKDGFAELRAEYDQRGNLTRESYFGVDGEPILHKDGYAEFRTEYDQRGNLTRESYFGVDGKPTLNKEGYSSRLFFYASNNEVVRVEFFDVEGKKVVPMAVIVSAEIIANSAAEQMGVKEGDVWCRLGAYDITKTSNVLDVIKPMQVARNEEKTLVVARKVEDVYKIYSFQFPVGLMGIEVADKVIHDYGKLIKAYKAYCEQEGKR